MIYKYQDLKRIQQVEIEILKEIIRVCKENNISYFLIYGTLLGAVRHKGFIPWDDDIDIGMMRNDYEHFLKIAPQSLQKNFFLQHYTTEKNSPTYHAKVRKNNTLFIEPYCENISMHKGIFVDIIPFDYIPYDKKIEQYIYIITVFVKKNIFISKSTSQVTTEKIKYKYLIKRVIRSIMFFCVKPVSKEKLFIWLDNAMKKYNHSPTKAICALGSIKSIQNYKDVFPLVKKSFDYLEVMCPNNFVNILTKQYGDYMKLPPVEQRYTHQPIYFKY